MRPLAGDPRSTLDLAVREAGASLLVVAARTLGEPASAATPVVESLHVPVVLVP